MRAKCPRYNSSHHPHRNPFLNGRNVFDDKGDIKNRRNISPTWWRNMVVNSNCSWLIGFGCPFRGLLKFINWLIVVNYGYNPTYWLVTIIVITIVRKTRSELVGFLTIVGVTIIVGTNHLKHQGSRSETRHVGNGTFADRISGDLSLADRRGLALLRRNLVSSRGFLAKTLRAIFLRKQWRHAAFEEASVKPKKLFTSVGSRRSWGQTRKTH